MTGAGRRRALADALDERRVALIEDDVLADLTFDGRRGQPMAGLCRAATVVTVGSLSKSCWGGLRFGWLRAGGQLVADTVRRRTTADLAPPVPSQLLGMQLLEQLDEIVADRRRALADHAELTAALLTDAMPDWLPEPPAAGLSLWVRLPIDDAVPIAQLARRHGVHVAAGATASALDGPDPHLRLCIDRPEPVLAEGVARLRRAWAARPPS